MIVGRVDLWKLVREYLRQIFEDMSYGIVHVADLFDHIFCGFPVDVLMYPDVHVVIDHDVGVDVWVIIHGASMLGFIHWLLINGNYKITFIYQANTFTQQAISINTFTQHPISINYYDKNKCIYR